MVEKVSCAKCGEPFEPSRTWHKFCSRYCYIEYHRLRAVRARALLRKLEAEEQQDQEHVHA
jgi:hypothetical protein